MGHKLTHLRICCDFFHEKEIVILRNCENGATCLIIYMKMLLLSLNNDGRIYFDGYFEDFFTETAIVLDEEPSAVFETVQHLIKLNLAEYETKNILKIYKPGRKRDRNTQEYKKWRADVYKRDNYTCKICNMRGVPIEAHHIKPWAKYPKERYDINNGITLCKECHKNIHRHGGTKWKSTRKTENSTG